MEGDSIQEFIISLVYIRATSNVLKHSLRPRTKSIMQQLIAINVLIIAMDVALLSVEYANLFTFETILKGFVYSIKLKCEFAILSRLVDAVGGRIVPGEQRKFSVATVGPNLRPGSDEDVSEFVDLTKVRTDYRYAGGSVGNVGGKGRSASGSGSGKAGTEHAEEARNADAEKRLSR
jgi:hypothetical protein